jgi:hypothetical protein
MTANFANAIKPLLAFTDDDHWRLGIGDPTFIGWFTVVAYFAAAWLCWRAARANAAAQKLRHFWMGLTLLLCLLGVNKQLDLQTALTFMGKDFAKATGWYENRRYFQFAFILLVATVGSGAIALLFRRYKRDLPRLRGALIGLGFLLIFVVARAASFHHVDQFLNFSPGGIRMNWVLELGAIACIAWPAWKAIKSRNQTTFTRPQTQSADQPQTPRPRSAPVEIPTQGAATSRRIRKVQSLQ